MDLEKFFLPILEALDISSSFNPTIIGLLFLIALLGEFNLVVPLLMESIWVLVGYQSQMSSLALLNIGLMLLAAMGGRQMGELALYYFFPVVNRSILTFLLRPKGLNRFYHKYIHNHIDKESLAARFLSSLLITTLGMLTLLNGPIRLLLICQRRLGLLLWGTLFSGLAFDGLYLLVGAIFRTTSLSIAYLPVFFLVIFLMFMYFRVKALR